MKNAERLKNILFKRIYKYSDCHDDIPKGCVAVRVGTENEFTRFVIPIFLLNHPLFMDFLEDAQHEVGFMQDGILRVPCSPQEFVQAKNLIVECSYSN